MMKKKTETNSNKGQIGWKTTLLISFIILFLGSIVTVIIFLTEPTAERVGATKETAMLVDIIRPQRSDYHPNLVTTGTVEASQNILLSPRVSGEVIWRSPAFIPGGFIRKGESLLQIDPSDYENTLKLRESELQQAQAGLKLEMGRQNVARQDYELVDEELNQENKALVLREPQLQSARSSVDAARAALEQARLDLDRTTIKAPFNAHILSRNINLGSQVSPGTTIGRIIGMDEYWVTASVPVSKLHWLSFPEGENQKGSRVKIRNRKAWGKGEYRNGYLYKLIGALDDQTRLARVLISVPDPLARKPESEGKPKLILGAFVETQIQADELRNVIRLNRDYIRKNETVWIMENKKLSIKDVNILLRDRHYAYIKEGLTEQDSVVTTNLSTVVEGSGLRLASDTTDKPKKETNGG